MSDHASHYARLHRQYLQRNRRKFYDALVRDGELNEHLRSVGQRAADMYETIVGQMEGRPEAPLVADEFVMDDVVCQPRD
jgi:hypothetical protein